MFVAVATGPAHGTRNRGPPKLPPATTVTASPERRIRTPSSSWLKPTVSVCPSLLQLMTAPEVAGQARAQRAASGSKASRRRTEDDIGRP
jgi:hypothetical protein